jgi:hypothetical protein
MKAFALAPVLALAAFTLAAPSLAEAAHRHSRDCGHRGYYSRDYRPIVRYHRYCRSGCGHRSYGAYGYRYYDPVPYYDSGYYGYVPPPPPLPRIYRHRRHHRPHVGIFLGF